MMGTLAPPPAYGSERGSILLDAGYGTPGARSITPEVLSAARRLIDENQAGVGNEQAGGAAASTSASSFIGVGRPIPSGAAAWQHGHRRGMSQPVVPSPLREGSLPARSNLAVERTSVNPMTGRRWGNDAVAGRYHSPTDQPRLNRTFPDASVLEEGRADEVVSSATSDTEDETGSTSSSQRGLVPGGLRRASSPGGSPLPHNPPTPNHLDISLHSFHGHSNSTDFFGGRASEEASGESGSSDETARQDDEVARRERRRQRRDARRSAQLASAGQDGLQARLHALVSGVMGPGASDVPPPGYAPLDPYRGCRQGLSVADVCSFLWSFCRICRWCSDRPAS